MKSQKSALGYLFLFLVGAGIFAVITDDNPRGEGSPFHAFLGMAAIISFIFYFAAIATLKKALIILFIPISCLMYSLYDAGSFHIGKIIVVNFPIIVTVLISLSLSEPYNSEHMSLSFPEKLSFGYKRLHTKALSSVKLFFLNIRELLGVKDRSVTGVLLDKIREILEDISTETLCDVPTIYGLLHTFIKNNPDKITESITEKGIEPIALMLIKQFLYAYLCTGEHHISRGVVGIQGQGFIEAYKIVNNKLYEKGYISQEIRDADLKSLNKDMHNIG